MISYLAIQYYLISIYEFWIIFVKGYYVDAPVFLLLVFDPVQIQEVMPNSSLKDFDWDFYCQTVNSVGVDYRRTKTLNHGFYVQLSRSDAKNK